jgi:hypothetical protein
MCFNLSSTLIIVEIISSLLKSLYKKKLIIFEITNKKLTKYEKGTKNEYEKETY